LISFGKKAMIDLFKMNSACAAVNAVSTIFVSAFKLIHGRRLKSIGRRKYCYGADRVDRWDVRNFYHWTVNTGKKAEVV
jgi:hypothetical protein